ncbi:hypothetical protein TSTA_107870 [Talaromyces stipitatus ATCC 10500]|uniref:Uncharacterized protein n=1 Tax=Talaromyces stipitatus (strain ATCC 10500 / CBS 375.48 / QM 6759 / NRRL 1006) TaxID=441959 RepID=B8MU92_TALSN|nr:uncharacterized protein TSTA_107870 [Talaromyces stipitatus ATCC 10500]EED11596.1 hypothetical protein TSTA_107870 [Talaromyces stipitatus ATCC 10500]
MEEDPAVTMRVGRVVVPSTRAREALEGADSIDATAATRRTSKVKPTAVRKAANQIEERQCAQDENQAMLRKMCQYLEGTYREEQNDIIKGLHVKEAAQKLNIPGWRVLRDQLYPVKIDNANRTAILDIDGNVLPGAVEALGKENNVDIAKITWLSKKDSNKAYGSMVVYITKGTDAKRLLEGNYFDIAGESAYTRAFEPRTGPFQYYNCQEIGYKAFACKKT